MSVELERVLNEILERTRGRSQEAEVFAVTQEETPVSFEANRLKEVQGRDTVSIGLRVIREGKMGFSSTSRLDDGLGLVDRAIETSPYGPAARFHFPSQHQPNSTLPLCDPNVTLFPIEDMVHLGQDLIDCGRAMDEEVIWDAHVGKATTTVHLSNTEGGGARYTKTSFGISLGGQLVRDEEMLFVGNTQASARLIGDIRPVSKQISRQMEWATLNRPTPQGDMPVVFMPSGVAQALLEPLLTGFSGKSVFQGTSPLAGRLGDQIVDRRLCLRDDPTTPFATGSRSSDDEGITTQPLCLIENGRAANFFYDLQTAGEAGTATTGSASRTPWVLPSPSVTVLILETGDTTLEEMIRDIKRGLIIEMLLGAGQGNMLGGDFNANVLLGYTIENGKVTGRAKDTMIHGNVYKVLSQIRALESSSDWVAGSLYLPALCADGVTVSARSS